MARPRGFEPLTFGSGGQRSIQLSYGRRNFLLYYRRPCRGARGGIIPLPSHPWLGVRAAAFVF